jgi:membrane protease YdiL (CAAX protease family)
VEIDLAFPTLFQVINNVVILVVGVVVVYLLSRALKLHPKPITIAGLRRETIAVFLVIVALFVARFALDTLGYLVVLPTFPLYELPPHPPLVAVDLFWGALMSAIYLVLMILAMKRTGQSLGSIGITGVDKLRNLALGLVLSAIYVGVTSLSGTFAGFSVSLVYAFILMAIVGFIQEVVWRGYVQTRLTAKAGTIKGLVATALLFALWHFPMHYFRYSGVALEALANIFVTLFPLSLLFGYIMLRCQNIIPLSILHLFVNFSTFLWQLP